MLIEVQSLNVRYGNKKVLENINLSVSSGEIVTIVGPNGSGTVSYTHLTLPTICSV